VVFGLGKRRMSAGALLAGWATGMTLGTWLAFSDGLKPVHTLMVGDASYAVYTGLLALCVNIVVSGVVQLLVRTGRRDLEMPGVTR
jgi:SSS family solute:Na+ symporter